jgi:cobaltochelatase CobN
VAAKNTDTREHDIADSDDYFQYHGGMVATVRALTGRRPRPTSATTPARRGAHPHAVRGDHAGVPRPRGQPAVDDGDAQARLQGRVRDGRDRRLPVRLRRDRGRDGRLDVRAAYAAYVLDDENRKFMAESNPWALHGMAERLLEAAERGMWAQPEADTLDGCARCCCETGRRPRAS